MYVGTGTNIVTAVADATTQLQQRYISSRFSSSVDEWPPYQPKHYTTLAFIHNKDRCTDAVRFAVTQELAVAGKINSSELHKYSHKNTNMTKNISDIFLISDGSSVDLHILIEGAPGIGKTVLAKEIAYQWANRQLLTFKKLLLLVLLREYHQKPIRSIEDLVQCVFKTGEMTKWLTIYLSNTEGKDAVFIFDGFDELSEENRKESIIVDIINRRILTKCCLVVTSRPTASSNLHGSVDRRVEIVGFTEEDRLDYIQSALDNNELVKDLQHYLRSNPTINALCYIPLNMTILLCLFRGGIDGLPKTQTEMYKKFIEITIVRFIKKHDNCDTIISITNLPHPHNKVFLELAKLAYEALAIDKIVFTLPEIKEGCPNLTMTSSNWNGLGLLKAVKCFSEELCNDQVTFHFLHFSLQEYMAAWHISMMFKSKQIKLLQKTFWEHRYYNVWIMYVGITCGSTFALKHFLSGNHFQFYTKLFKTSKVSNKYLKHKMKCLHLFQCLVEANKEDIIDSVKQLFQNNQIDVSNQTLLPSDLNTLGFFLIRSINNKWDELNLSNCNIGSNGISILCDIFLDKDFRYMVTIKMVNFSYNQLNFSSLRQLFGLFNSWQTSEIIITDDAIHYNTNDMKALEDIVLQSNTLVLALIGSFLFLKSIQLNRMLPILFNTTSIRSVYLLNCSWESSDSELLTLLEKQKLSKIHIIGSSLDKVFIKTMVLILLNNNGSVNMFIYNPTMPDQMADDISSLIYKDISGVLLIVSKSKIQGIVNTCTLSNELSALELFNLSIYIRYLNIKMCLWKEKLEGNSCKKEIVYTFVDLLYKVDFSWKLQIILQENSTVIVHKVEFKSLIKLIQVTNNSVVYLSSCDVNGIETECDVIYEKCLTLYILNSPYCVELLYAELLNKDSVPNEIFINDNIHYYLVNNWVELLSNYYTISATLAINNVIVANHPSSEQIALALQLQPSPTTLIISATDNCDIFYQVTDALAILHNEWIELNFAGCNIGDIEYEILYGAFRCKSCLTVSKLSISFNKLSVLGMRDFVKIVLMCRVQELDINGTNDVLLDAFLDCLIKNLIHEHQNLFLSITYNRKIFLVISNASWDEIAMKTNTQVSELYIINCNLQLNSTEIIYYLHSVCNLIRLCIINGSVSETIIFNIFEFFMNKNVEVSISNIRIIDNDRTIKNLLTSRMFYHGAKFNLLLSTNHWLCIYNKTKHQLRLMPQYFMNRNLPDCNGMTLVKKFKQLNGDKVCIFENDLVHLLCLYGNITDSFMNSLVEFTSHYDHKITTVLVADDIAVGIHPSSEQIAQAFLLQPSPTTWIWIQLTAVTTSVTYQLIDALTIVHTQWIELDFTCCDIGDIECEIFYRNLRLNDYSTVRKLSISLNKLSVAGMSDLVGIISIWKVQELNISKTSDIHYDCLIKNLISISKHQNHLFLSVTYNQKVSHIIFNERWDEIISIMNNPVSELYIINCELKSEEIASYVLEKLCIINGTVSETALIKILKRFLVNKFELSISNIRIIDNDRMIRNLITSKEFYHDIKLNLVLSTEHWLCVYNLTKYQLKFIHHYFMSKTSLNCHGTTVATKLEQTSGHKMFVFENNDLKLARLCAGVPYATDATQIIAALSNTTFVTTIEIDNYRITTDNLANILQCKTQLQELHLSGNYLQINSADTIATALRSTVTLKTLSICNSNITAVAADDIATIISHNIHLQELNLGSNNLQASGALKIARSLQKISSLTKLYINHNNITHEATDDIAAAISCNTKLQEFDVSGNNIQTVGAVKIMQALKGICTLRKLCISNNNITNEAAIDIAAAISCNTRLQEFDISGNNIQSAGTIKIMTALKGIWTLRRLYFSNNKITDEAADEIAAAISLNSKLQDINLSGNYLQTMGTNQIMKALKGIRMLKVLHLNNNNISVKAANNIARAIRYAS